MGSGMAFSILPPETLGILTFADLEGHATLGSSAHDSIRAAWVTSHNSIVELQGRPPPGLRTSTSMIALEN